MRASRTGAFAFMSRSGFRGSGRSCAIAAGWCRRTKTALARLLQMAKRKAPEEADLFAAAGVPKESLSTLRREAAGCTRCDLYKHATQTVFGEGPAQAQIVLVGEQPGGQEA